MALTPFGKAVRKARVDGDISLTDMAAELDITPAFLSAVETGRKKVPEQLTNRIKEYLEARGVVPVHLNELADVSNSSVSLEGLSPEHQFLVANLAHTDWKKVDATELEDLKELLGRIGSK